MGRKAAALPDRLVLAEDLIPDQRLIDTTQDRFEHEALARALAEIAFAAESPVNIALFGAWGAGKSSVYSMVSGHLNRLAGNKIKIARYDAWKYGGKALKRNFVETMTRELKAGDDEDLKGLHEPTEVTELRLGRWLWRNWGSLALGVIVAICVAALSLVVLAYASVVLGRLPFTTAVAVSLAPAGTVLGLALVALLVGPKMLEAAVNKVSSTPPSDDDQFSQRFSDLVKKVCRKGTERLVIFIDELDRCSPEDVVSTLVDLKTFLDQPRCVFIVAADREVIERSLQHVPQAKPVRSEEPYYSTPGAFLDKIFQHQIALPPLRPRALTRFAYSLVQDQGGVWAELRGRDSSLLEAVVFALIPIHVRSPRRVKVLLNSFATNARIAQGRNLPWLDRAKELAVFTVLETEFPSVAADLVQVPRLLQFLRDTGSQPSRDADEVVRRYRPRPNTEIEARTTDAQDNDGQTESAAGELLADDENTDSARDTLNRQLLMYLEKIHAGGIPDPKPDLFYLQGAGRTEAELEPRLGDLIDLASDTPPSLIVESFTGQPQRVLNIAVPLIVAVGEDNLGPGRFLAIESACRLVEQMDIDGLRAIAGEIAPVVMAAAGSNSFPLQATPGAVLLALLSDAPSPIGKIVRLAAASDAGDSLIERIADTLPFARDQDASVPICSMLEESYGWRPEPLHHSLRTLPLKTALDLWRSIEQSVLRTLVSLELDKPASDEPPQSQRAIRSAAADPEPTGAGLERMTKLLDAVSARPDCEALTAAVFESMQSIETDPLRTEVTALAVKVVEALSDAGIINRLVLAGLTRADSSQWGYWAGLLVEVDGTDRLSETHARQFISSRLLPQLSIEVDRTVVGALPALAESLATMSATVEDDGVKDAFLALISALTWNVDEDEAAVAAGITYEIRDAQRIAAHATGRVLRRLVGSDVVDQALANDVFSGVKTITLDDVAQPRLIQLIGDLSEVAASQLSSMLDGWKAPAEEKLQRCQLQLHARIKAGGKALNPSEMPATDDGPISADILDTWLRLNPPVEHAVRLIAQLMPRKAALSEYVTRLAVPGRTQLWVSAEGAAGTDALLRMLGGLGVGAAAVRHMHEQTNEDLRQHDRDRVVQRLISASVPDVDEELDQLRKAASRFALDLLDRGSVGDAKLAAKLVIWSGGAGRGHVQSLRREFDLAAEHRATAFSKSTLAQLVDLNLLTPRKKGPLEWLFNR